MDRRAPGTSVHRRSLGLNPMGSARKLLVGVRISELGSCEPDTKFSEGARSTVRFSSDVFRESSSEGNEGRRNATSDDPSSSRKFE